MPLICSQKMREARAVRCSTHGVVLRDARMGRTRLAFWSLVLACTIKNDSKGEENRDYNSGCCVDTAANASSRRKWEQSVGVQASSSVKNSYVSHSFPQHVEYFC